MPSDRKMIPVRVTADDEIAIAEVQTAMRDSTGLSPSYSDLFRAGLAELKRKYGPKKVAKKHSAPVDR